MGKFKNTALVQGVYAAFLNGDIPGVLNRLADDVEWTVGVPSQVPWFGARKGKAAVQEFFQTLGQEVDMTTLETTDYVAQHDKVIAFVRMEFTVKRTNKTVAQDIAMVWTVRDGAIAGFHTYEDTAAVIGAWDRA